MSKVIIKWLFTPSNHLIITWRNASRSDILTLLRIAENICRAFFVSSSAKRITTQILITAKLNERKDLVLRGCVYDMILSQQTVTCWKLAIVQD